MSWAGSGCSDAFGKYQFVGGRLLNNGVVWCGSDGGHPRTWLVGGCKLLSHVGYSKGVVISQLIYYLRGKLRQELGRQPRHIPVRISRLLRLSLSYFSLMGFYHLDTGATLLRLAMVSLAATVVESLPISTKLDDNVTVPLTTVVMGMLLFPSTSTNAFAKFPQVNFMEAL